MILHCKNNTYILTSSGSFLQSIYKYQTHLQCIAYTQSTPLAWHDSCNLIQGRNGKNETDLLAFLSLLCNKAHFARVCAARGWSLAYLRSCIDHMHGPVPPDQMYNLHWAIMAYPMSSNYGKFEHCSFSLPKLVLGHL